MKKLYFTFLLFVSTNFYGQTVFSTAFGGEFPVPIQIINSDLYVGTFNTQKLYRLDINNPSTITTVANLTNLAWKMDYDPANNDMYMGNIAGGLVKIDLDQSLPITPENINFITDLNGITIDGNIVYIASGKSIYSYDTSIGVSSYQLFFDETEGSVRNPKVFNGELYYNLVTSSGMGSNNLYKIELSSPSTSKTLVSTSLGGISQSSLLVGNYLYIGTESSNNLLRYDLTQSLPIVPVTVLSSLGAGVIGLAHSNGTIYYVTGQQIIYSLQDSVLSNNDVGAAPFSLYPNPSNDYIQIKTDRIVEGTYAIFNVNGVKVDTGNYTNQIKTSNLKPGLYFLNLKQNGNSYTMKFLKN